MSLSLAKRVLEACRRQDLAPAGSRLAVAVSGGMDSVVLLDLLLEIRGALRVELVVATVDHGLRTGTSSVSPAFDPRLAIPAVIPSSPSGYLGPPAGDPNPSKPPIAAQRIEKCHCKSIKVNDLMEVAQC